MSLYVTCTITGALNATTITGTGTKWSDAKLGITNGSVLFVSSNAGVDGVYQVKRVISDTSIELAQPIYKAFTNSKYSILVAESASTAAWSNQLAATLGYYQAQMDGWQQIMTGTGDVALTAPDGTKITIKSFTALDKNKADKSALGSAASKDTGGGIGDVMEVGYFGLGGPALSAGNEKACGYYRAIAGASGNPLNNSGVILNHQVYGSNAFTRFATSYELPIPRVFVSTKVNANYYPYYEFYTTGNTTKSSDGTLKVASPVINIFHDGTFETSSEAQGAEVKRISEGVYRIQNILGMNSDGAWGGIDGGFDVPKDRNGQHLVWLDYEVDADGSILVKTYHRTYPEAPAFARNIKDGYEESDPIDIPSDQFLSVRVEMPQDSIWNQAQKAAQEAMAQEQSAEE